MSKTNIQPVTEHENRLIGKVSSATFPAGSSHKRFMRNWGPPESRKLSDEGRRYLAYIAWRYRKQYKLSPDDLLFIRKWIYEPIPKALESVMAIKDTLPAENQRLFITTADVEGLFT